MAAKTKTKMGVDYRALKKMLSPFHSFSFNNPRGRGDFLPQQKSAITKKYNELFPLIRNVAKDKMTFIKYPRKSRMPGVDGFRTNKGIFFKFPGAKVFKGPDGKWHVGVYFKKRREIFIAFPPDVQGNPEWIEIFIEGKKQEFKPPPDYIRLSVNGYRASTEWENFELAIESAIEATTQSTKGRDKSRKKIKSKRRKDEVAPYFNGVFFGWNPRRRRIIWEKEQ